MTVPPREVVELLGGDEALTFYRRLVELDTTNLEDMKSGRVEKRNYQEACELVKSQAQAWGFSARIFDPTKDPDNVFPHHHGASRPTVIVDYDVGAPERLLILAHYDCVPVPEAQARLWKYPPHKLTWAGDRFYGRGSNDDKGSGVFCTLQALRELREAGARKVNVRMIAACDEETGGSGGLGAILAKDAISRKRGEKPILDGHLAMLPDASPNVLAGSSGVTFVDLSIANPAPAANLPKLLSRLLEFRAVAQARKSQLDSGDWPDEGAPDPKITGRFTVTKLDWQSASERKGFRVRRIHAETDSYNTIPEIVTLEFDATPEGYAVVQRRIAALPPDLAKRVEMKPAKENGVVEGTILLHGKGGHGGYPHRFDNPVHHAAPILDALFGADPLATGTGNLGFDMRTIPEEDPKHQFALFEKHAQAAIRELSPGATLKLPDHGMRPGYFVPPDNADVQLLKRAFEAVSGKPSRVIGEYGGTDASFFAGVPTATGKPMVALLFGSMDNEANIHSWNENAKPHLLRQNIDVIAWIAKNWQPHA